MATENDYLKEIENIRRYMRLVGEGHPIIVFIDNEPIQLKPFGRPITNETNGQSEGDAAIRAGVLQNCRDMIEFYEAEIRELK